jgi:DNA primase
MDEVTEVKARLEITEVIGSYVPLKQAGRNLKAPCPFHEEKSASFMVSPEKGIYKCFGCGEGGDIFNFVMKMEGLDFRSSLEMLARKAGVELTARKGENQEVKQLRDRLIEEHELATRYFQLALKQYSPALEYVFKQRHLTKQTLLDFRIGYAPKGWNGLTDSLRGRGFSQRELLQGGLAGQREGRSTIYDMFRDRIMFPIADRSGQTIGFTGRVLDDGMPKYLNTPQTPLYDKSQAIFGFHLAKEAVRSKGEVVFVEGNMDVVASHQAGIKQVVAASGTALTLQQLKQFKGLAKRVILAFDSDKAGIAATQRAVPLAQQLGLELHALELKGAKDADELIQKDPALWEEAIKQAQEIRDYWIDKGLQQYDLNSAFGKRQFIERMLQIVSLYSSDAEGNELLRYQEGNIDQEVFIARVKELTQIDLAVQLKEEAAKPKKATPKASPVASPTVARTSVERTHRTSVRAQREELYLALCLLYREARASLADLDKARFSSEPRKSVYELLKKHPKDSVQALVDKSDSHQTYINQLLLIGEEELKHQVEKGRVGEKAFELAHFIIADSNTEYKQAISQALGHAQAQGDTVLQAELLKKFKAILDSEA